MNRFNPTKTMQTSSLRLALTLSLGLATTAPAFAQAFVGSTNFDGGSTTGWAFAYRLNSASQGALDFSNNRLDVTQAAAGTGNRYRTWDGNPSDAALTDNGARTTASFTTSWNMDISATNQLSGLASGQFLSVGLSVRSGSDYFASFLLSTPSGFTVTRENVGGFSTQVGTTATSNSDVRLRISWDAGTQLLSTAYSFDSGTSYTNLGSSYAVSGWTADSPSNGFLFETFMNANLGSPLTAGTAFMDNFSVSAVPEPSAFAALAGLAMLGLAATRRRTRA